MGATAAYMQWAIICGAIPTILNVVLAYLLRSEGAAVHASIGTMSGCIMNIILDPIFIFGLHMDVAGAAIATVISQFVSCVWVMKFLLGKKTTIQIKKEYFKDPFRYVSK